MKTSKYLLIGTMLIGLSMPAMAQDNKTRIDEVTNIIKSKPADLADQLKQIYKQNKKNPEVLCGIGRAFYNMKDTTNAKIYAEYALKANKEYGQAYTLLGDIAARAEDGNAAIQNYQQAIYFSPKEPEAYFKYATAYRKLNPSEAISKLEELRVQRPDIAVDALIGRIHYSSNDFEKAISSFEKVDMNSMEESDLTNYAMSLWFTQKYDKSLEVAKAGLKNSHATPLSTVLPCSTAPTLRTTTMHWHMPTLCSTSRTAPNFLTSTTHTMAMPSVVPKSIPKP